MVGVIWLAGATFYFLSIRADHASLPTIGKP
jgi:hypothetical protein